MKRYTCLLDIKTTQLVLQALEAVQTTARRNDCFALSMEATGKGFAYSTRGSQYEDGAPFGGHGGYGAQQYGR